MKLTNDDIPALVNSVVKHGLPTDYVANLYGVGVRRVQQLCKQYRDNEAYPVLRCPGRPTRPPDSLQLKNTVIETKKKLRSGSTVVAQYVRKKRNIRIGNGRVHQILLENYMAHEDPRKRGRKKPWVRYERKHPLSAVHMDWHLNKNREQVCAVTDDSTRMILAITEEPRISAKGSIELLRKANEKFSHIRDIREVITDHGAEFYANKRDKHGNAKHPFELFCKRKGIKHILCRVKHPQTNGKLEKFFHIYDLHRWGFDSLEEFVHWYNVVRPHMSLNFDELETPEQAFYDRLTPILVGNYSLMIERELDDTWEDGT